MHRGRGRGREPAPTVQEGAAATSAADSDGVKRRHDPDGKHISDNTCAARCLGAHAVEKLSCNTAELRSWVVLGSYSSAGSASAAAADRCS